MFMDLVELITLSGWKSTARASVTGVATREVRLITREPELSRISSRLRGPESEGTRPKFSISWGQKLYPW